MTPGDPLRRALKDGEQAGSRYSLGRPRQAPAGTAGESPGRRAGSSLEFRDYRQYHPGDDIRHIDWNAFARTDELHLKRFREEVAPHIDIVVDGSRSMALEDSQKAQATAALAAFFTAAGANSGYTHRTWLLANRFRALGPLSSPPQSWEGMTYEFRGPPVEAFRHPPAWRPRATRILLSDLLWLGDPLAVLAPFADRAATVVVVQILAQADTDPPLGKSLRLVDSETEAWREVFIDEAAHRRYRNALARHQQNWSRACRQVGAVITTVIAETLLQDWCLEELIAAEFLSVP